MFPIPFTISIDKDVIEHFKFESKNKGALRYQTQINQALRQFMDKPHSSTGNVSNIKDKLLHDKTFIKEIAKRIVHGNAK